MIFQYCKSTFIPVCSYNRGYKNSPNTFCYLCGDFVVKKHQRNIIDFVKKVYFLYFGIEIGNQDKCCVPCKVCYVCVVNLRKWYNKEQVSRNKLMELKLLKCSSHKIIFLKHFTIKGMKTSFF